MSARKLGRPVLSAQEKGCVLWFTGLSGAGKTTLASLVKSELNRLSIYASLLDGDSLRNGLNRDLGFGQEDRKENVRRVGEVAKLFTAAGVVPLISAISPYREDRESVRSLFKPREFIEVYVKCTVEECERRDPKGLYKKARRGEIREFTGISAPYEEPLHPELIVESDKQTIQESLEHILAYLREQRHLTKKR